MTSSDDELEGLLHSIEAGEDVSPLDLAAARERATINLLRAQGEARRASEEAEAERIAKQTALIKPHQKRLDISQQRLIELQQKAYEATLALLEAADNHNQLIAATAGAIEKAGLPDPRVPAQGYRNAIVIGGKSYSHWLPQFWANNVIAAVNQRWPLHRGRWSREHIPLPVREMPRPIDSP